jgi:hypothetical protein
MSVSSGQSTEKTKKFSPCSRPFSVQLFQSTPFHGKSLKMFDSKEKTDKMALFEAPYRNNLQNA